MREVIDLHTHTSYSDGVLNPADLINRAAKHGVRALSITDHDNVDAYSDPATADAAAGAEVELIPGIELSTVDENNCKIHVLGLFIDPEAHEIQEAITRQHTSRLQYAIDVSHRLKSDGWHMDADNLFNNRTITKAHIADCVIMNPANSQRLIKQFGERPTRGQFIEGMMNEGGAYYIKRRSIAPANAISIIHAAGGLAVLAHPVANVMEGMNYEKLVEHISTNAYDGLEALYYYYSKSHGDKKIDEIDRYVRVAKEAGLLVTGGSDFHGESPTLGNYVEIGFAGEERAPDMALLDALQSSLPVKG